MDCNRPMVCFLLSADTASAQTEADTAFRTAVNGLYEGGATNVAERPLDRMTWSPTRKNNVTKSDYSYFPRPLSLTISYNSNSHKRL